jgi:hypothetical protein
MSPPFELPGHIDYLSVLAEHKYDYDAALKSLIDKYKLQLPRRTIDEIAVAANRSLYHALVFLYRESPGSASSNQILKVREYLIANHSVEYAEIQQMLKGDYNPRRANETFLVSRHPELIPEVCKYLIKELRP